MSKLIRCFLAAALLTGSCCLALTIPGADGSDGALHVTTADCVNGVYTISLAHAATKAWDAKPAKAGEGVYDPDKWAVVFKYSSVTIDEGCTVRFLNHPSNPPVYWLVSGDVAIHGVVNLDGQKGQDYTDTGVPVCATPGPGGFAGGLGMTHYSRWYTYGGGGYGPGGAVAARYVDTSQPIEIGGSYAEFGKYESRLNYDSNLGHLYGDASLVPLLGGSGGCGGNGNGGGYSRTGGGAGGAGGGAICIAAGGKVTLEGTISARGGRGGVSQPFKQGTNAQTGLPYYSVTAQGGCGSGGAVRILADKMTGQGSIDVSSNGENVASLSAYFGLSITYYNYCALGSDGRIRLDVNDLSSFGTRYLDPYDDRFHFWEVKPALGTSDQAVLWAEAKVTPLTLGGVSLPSDPQYRADGYNECISFASTGERELVFRTENIPTDANIVVKVTPRQSGKDFTGTTVVATMDEGGTYASASWRAMIPLNAARTTFQVLVSTIALYE